MTVDLIKRNVCDDCTQEYGPCEEHGEVLISREGASLRTGDELGHLFLQDAQSLGVELSPYGLDVQRRVGEELDAAGAVMSSWLDDDGLRDELRAVESQVQEDLATLGLDVYWEDGYRILRVTGGPLAE